MDAIDKLDEFRDMDETFNVDEIDHMWSRTLYCAAKIEQYHEWNFHHIDGHLTIVDENDDFDSIAMHESFHMGEIQWSYLTIWMKFNTEVKLVHGWKQAHLAELDHISEIDHKDGFWTILYELHHMHDIVTWIKLDYMDENYFNY